MTVSEKVKRLELHAKYAIGLDISERITHTSKSTLWRLRKAHNIISRRQFDTAYVRHALTYNDEIPTNMITHAFDGYGLSDGSIRKRRHARTYVRWEDKAIIKINMIVNLKTHKVYWTVYHDPTETTVKTLQTIQKALDNGEVIEYLRMDRKVNAVIEGLEDMGITPVIYGKSTTTPYNSPAEAQFGNLSKCFYENLDTLKEITLDEATQLFESILMVYWEYDDTQLKAFDELMITKAERITIEVTQQIPKREKEA